MLSHLKYDQRFSLKNKQFTSFKKSDIIKNSKNHKQKFSQKIIKALMAISDGKKLAKAKSKSKFKSPNNYAFKRKLSILNFAKSLQIRNKFDFNSIILLLYGCCKNF